MIMRAEIFSETSVYHHQSTRHHAAKMSVSVVGSNEIESAVKLCCLIVQINRMARSGT